MATKFKNPFAGKSKGSSGSEPDDGTADVQTASATKGKRSKSTLSSVVNESTPAAARDLVKANLHMVDSEGRRGAILVLPVERVGGLSASHTKDESKGSAVTLIKNDHIHALTTPEMLQREELGLIPDSSTLDRIDEHMFLRNATYLWGVVDISELAGPLQVEITDIEVDIPTVRAVHSGDSVQDMDELLWEHLDSDSGSGATALDAAPESPAADSSSDDETNEGDEEEREVASTGTDPSLATNVVEEDAFALLEDPPTGPIPAAQGSGSADEESDSDQELVPVDDEAEELAQQELLEAQAAAAGSDFGEPEPEESMGFGEVDDEDDEEDGDYDEEDPDAVYTDAELEAGQDDEEGEDDEPVVEQLADGQTWVEDPQREVDATEAAERLRERFSAGDLELKVDTDPFESYFSSEPIQVELPITSDGTVPDWLVEQADLQATTSNNALRVMHAEHSAHLRRLYVDTVEKFIATLEPQYDLHSSDPDNEWSQIYATITARHESDKDQLDRVVVDARRDIEKRYLEEADRQGEVAREKAREGYLERTQTQRENEMSNSERELRAYPEVEFEKALANLNSQRQQVAQQELDAMGNELLELLTATRKEQSDREMAVVEDYRQQIQSYIDAHRKDALARSEHLAEEHRRQDAASSVRNEFTERIAAINAEHAEVVDTLTARVDELRQQSAAEANSLREQWDAAVADERRRADQLRAELQQVRGQLSGDQAAIDHAVSQRTAELQSRVDQHEAEMAQTYSNQVRTNWMMALLMVAIAVCALLLGLQF